MGIRISKFNLEKSLEDFQTTMERIAMAAKWNEETISTWERKRRDTCGKLIEEAGLALKKAEDREADEAVYPLWRPAGASW